MWEKIRAVWQGWSIFIVGMFVIFGSIYLGGRLSSSTQPATAISSDQAASSNRDQDSGKPPATSTATTSPPPQGGAATQPVQQAAQSSKASSQPATGQNKPAPAAASSANAAAPSPPAAAAPAAYDHMAADQMAASNTPPPSATTGQSPASPVSNAPSPAPAMAATGDASAGRLVFRKCQACHSIEPGKNMIGPSLSGVIGRKAGTAAGYNYSPAMKSADIVWSAQTLDQYLTDPAKVVPGNKMPFPVSRPIMTETT